MHLDGVQIPWTLLPSSCMSCYPITAQDSSQRPCDPHCSRPYHPLNVLDEWLGSFSIFSTSMISKMALIHVYQEEGQAEKKQLSFLLLLQYASFAYQDVERAFNSTKGA